MVGAQHIFWILIFNLDFQVPLTSGVCMHAESLQLCLTFCNPMDHNPLGSSIHGILQAYWSGLPCPSPGDLPDPGVEPGSPALQADALSSEPPGKLRYWCADVYAHQ